MQMWRSRQAMAMTLGPLRAAVWVARIESPTCSALSCEMSHGLGIRSVHGREQQRVLAVHLRVDRESLASMSSHHMYSLGSFASMT